MTIEFSQELGKRLVFAAVEDNTDAWVRQHETRQRSARNALYGKDLGTLNGFRLGANLRFAAVYPENSETTLEFLRNPRRLWI